MSTAHPEKITENTPHIKHRNGLCCFILTKRIIKQLPLIFLIQLIAHLNRFMRLALVFISRPMPYPKPTL